MPDNIVSMVGYEGMDSVSEAIDLCDGFFGLSPADKVLIKPNLVAWDDQGPFPPWGVLTTSVVMEGICRALKDAGVDDIRIGEGSILCKSIGSGTTEIYERLGYHKLVERYGVTLIDFNKGGHETLDLGNGHLLEVSDQAGQCDFFINVPVLKTHVETVVSLGMKNLKGLLHNKSKRFCHHPEGMLEHFICLLGEKFPPSLTIIDGLYSLERGPLHFGRARPRDLLIASTDLYAADLLGAYVLGYDAAEVKHLNEYAQRTGRSKDIQKLTIKTANEFRDHRHRKNNSEDKEAPALEKARRRLPYDWDWSEDGTCPELYEMAGIKGVILPKYDHTLCTGCSLIYIPLMVNLMSAAEKNFDNFEFLTGKKMAPCGHAGKTFLVGKCQCEMNGANPACNEIIQIKGCPPTIDNLFKAFDENGITISPSIYDQYRTDTIKRYWLRPKLFPLEYFYLDKVPEDAVAKD